VTTVIGFPLGANTSSIKAQEAKQAVSDGADEIDMVINLGALIDEDDQAVLNDIQQVRQAIPNQVLKVILETGFLNEAQIIKACQLAMQAKADFVKTSTGFGPRGASVEDIKLMVKTVKPALQVKASGGIRSFADAQAMIEAGADRIGASASVAILQSQKSSKE
jgi:deoxyribose-phosphate aldolase